MAQRICPKPLALQDTVDSRDPHPVGQELLQPGRFGRALLASLLGERWNQPQSSQWNSKPFATTAPRPAPASAGDSNRPLPAFAASMGSPAANLGTPATANGSELPAHPAPATPAPPSNTPRHQPYSTPEPQPGQRCARYKTTDTHGRPPPGQHR